MFGGVQRLAAGKFTLSATPANALELEWFRERYPLTLHGCEKAFRKLAKTEKKRMASIREVERDCARVRSISPCRRATTSASPPTSRSAMARC